MQSIRDQSMQKCRFLLSQINRDKATQTYGCFDRRYWAWKLVDYPEATYQRNIYPLSWYLDQPEVNKSPHLTQVIKAGLKFTLSIQHRDGSFDQAYPNEHSYGATAFLLPDLINTYQRICEVFTTREKENIENHFTRSADFLLEGKELHGFISNHLAGAAYGLLKAYEISSDINYQQKSKEVIDSIIERQSDEGWFLEYDGADPGYQTLCMYYLARIYKTDPRPALHAALKKSLTFLQHFIHPDGTFGGEYGSRRTEIYYPGGIASLTDTFPIAASMHMFMSKAISDGKTVTLTDVDIGNTAPLLSNFILTLSSEKTKTSKPIQLPHQKIGRSIFAAAGIAIESTKNYYAILGSSNGGVLKVYDKESGELFYDDCGVLGKTENGRIISNQFTNTENPLKWKENICETQSSFFVLPMAIPTALNYFLLRAANLSLMQVRFINEWVKKFMVKALLRSHDNVPLERTRKIEFGKDKITISDRFEKIGRVQIEYLQQGVKFSSIHMASSRYFSPQQLAPKEIITFNGKALDRNGEIIASIEISAKNKTVIRKI